MKKKSVALMMLACGLCIQTPAAVLADTTASAESSEAQVKQGLLKESGKYYYYVDGVKLKSSWKTIKVKGKSYRYYFGKNGAAYMGKTDFDGAVVPAVKKIGGSYYAFDTKGRMLKGTQVINGKFYVFSSKTGKMNKTTTNKLRKASKQGASVTTLKKLLKNLGLKPKKTKYLSYSCYGDGVDGTISYSNFKVSIFKGSYGKLEVLGVMR